MDKRLVDEWKKLGNILVGTTRGGRDNQNINFVVSDGRTISAKCFGEVAAGDAIALRDDNGQWYAYSSQARTQNQQFTTIRQYRKTKIRNKDQNIFGIYFMIYGSTPGDQLDKWVGAPGTGTRKIYISNGDIVKQAYAFDAYRAFDAYLSEMPEYLVLTVKFEMTVTANDDILASTAATDMHHFKINKITLEVEEQYDFYFDGPAVYPTPTSANLTIISPLDDWRKSQTSDFRSTSFFELTVGNPFGDRLLFGNINTGLSLYPYKPEPDFDPLIQAFREQQYGNLSIALKEFLVVSLFAFDETVELNIGSYSIEGDLGSYAIPESPEEFSQELQLSEEFLSAAFSARFTYYCPYRV